MKSSKRFVEVGAKVGALSGMLLACTGSVRDPGSGAVGSGASSASGTVGSGGPSSNGAGATTGSPGSSGSGTSGSPNGTPPLTGGDPSVPPAPFEASNAITAVRKVKNLLTGMAPTDEDVALVKANGAAGLQQLINTWMSDPEFQPLFRDKMITLFRNAFQQQGFIPTEDFKHQLLENGGFDFGPFGTGAVGDDIFYRLVQNLEDSFARTAWQLIEENRPFSEVITTERFMMTTALKSLYLQIEMPNDQPYAGFGGKPQTVSWKVDMSGNDIPLEETLDPNSPNYLVFDDELPVNQNTGFRGGGNFTTCQGTADKVNEYTGYANLFQRLIGFTQRYKFVASPECWEHASKPYFTAEDVSDWGWVTVSPKAASEAYVQPYDLPVLRKLSELKLALPRVGFFTTPAFLALWNTNDSNQHRVTANQTLLVALGQSFTSENAIVPVSTSGLDSTHSVTGSECYGCHKGLDPLRQFWSGVYDYNDRNDFPARGNFMGGAANPRPSSASGAMAFLDVNSTGAGIRDLPRMLLSANDTSDPAQPINRFALAFTQKLCFFANSVACREDDPEFRRVALAFQSSNYAFPTLVKELFSSPLVTGDKETLSFASGGLAVSIARRDQFCQSMSNRLGLPDVCAGLAPLPTAAQKNTQSIAANIPADAFGRGSENPVTPTDPTLFFRAASEMLCEDISTQVVDAASGTSLYRSQDPAAAIADMVTRVLGYAPSDPHYADAVQILNEHYTAAKDTSKATATNALRSTFAAACQSPTSLSFGL